MLPVAHDHQQTAAISNHIDAGLFTGRYGLSAFGARLHPNIPDPPGNGLLDHLFRDLGRRDNRKATDLPGQLFDRGNAGKTLDLLFHTD